MGWVGFPASNPLLSTYYVLGMRVQCIIAVNLHKLLGRWVNFFYPCFTDEQKMVLEQLIAGPCQAWR